MTVRKPEIEGISIVLLGNFNPSIFQPEWFIRNNIIQEKEGHGADIKIIHPDITEFSSDWLSIRVTRDRFIAQTENEAFFPFLNDFVINTFTLLNHTPINKMGINVIKHFKMESEDTWHKFGHLVSPKEIWNKVLTNPGLRSITIEGNHDRYGFKGDIKIRVEPSPRLRFGIFCEVNDHYEISEEELNQQDLSIIKILEEVFGKSVKKSEEIIANLMENQ